MPNQVKHKIKGLRKKNGDTLKNLATKINYDYSNLSKIERGLYEPSISLLRKISDVYGVEINYFLNEYNYTSEEISFTEDLDISSEELFEYHFVLDGKELSAMELDLVIKIIRKLRMAINEQQNDN